MRKRLAERGIAPQPEADRIGLIRRATFDVTGLPPTAEEVAAFVADESPEAYERLILDMLLGDPPLFPRHEEVELSWKVLDPIEEFWAASGKPEQYAPGSWGPESAHEMMRRDGREWRRP